MAWSKIHPQKGFDQFEIRWMVCYNIEHLFQFAKEDKMETSLINDIKRGLSEKRAALDEWCESCSQAEKETCLGLDGESKLHNHFHVIDSSLQKIEEGAL